MATNSGTEPNGVEWSVIDKGDIYTIMVRGNGKVITEDYHCTHQPIWGLDVSDVQGINNLLDKLIKEISR